MSAHTYLSTSCLHDRHDYCNAAEGATGPKAPGRCKFCAARCVCPCHCGAACIRVGLHHCDGEWKNHDRAGDVP